MRVIIIAHSQRLIESNTLALFRAVFSLLGHSLPLLYTDLCLLQPWSDMHVFLHLAIGVRYLPSPLSSSVSASCLPAIIQISLTHAQQVCFTHAKYKEDHLSHHVVALEIVAKTQAQFSFDFFLLFNSCSRNVTNLGAITSVPCSHCSFSHH